MTPRLCTTLVVLTVCAVLSVAVQPAVAQTATAGSNTNEWTPSNVIALIAAIGALITRILAALRGTAAQSKTDAHEQRINTIAARQDTHAQEVSHRLGEHSNRINEIATNMVPPALLPQLARQTGTGDGGVSPPRQ